MLLFPIFLRKFATYVLRRYEPTDKMETIELDLLKCL